MTLLHLDEKYIKIYNLHIYENKLFHHSNQDCKLFIMKMQLLCQYLIIKKIKILEMFVPK